MEATDFKKRAHALIDSLPDKASWEDLMEKIYVCQAVEAGLADSRAGRVHEVDKVRELFGLEP